MWLNESGRGWASRAVGSQLGFQMGYQPLRELAGIQPARADRRTTWRERPSRGSAITASINLSREKRALSRLIGAAARPSSNQRSIVQIRVICSLPGVGPDLGMVGLQ